MIDVVWDMETEDPDDFLTLLLLLGHPRVRLKAVTIAPGTPEQVGLIRWALEQFDRDIPVGAFDRTQRGQVSQWHYDAYGDVSPSHHVHPGADVLRGTCDAHTTLLTGAPLRNLGVVLDQHPEFELGRWVAQGGFAGEGVVPTPEQLPKFRGLEVCPTYNLSNAPNEAERALAHPGIQRRYFVSKNVCHNVIYDAELHQRVGAARSRARHLDLIWQGMACYLSRKGSGSRRSDKPRLSARRVRLMGPEGEALGVVKRQKAQALARAASMTLIFVDDADPNCPRYRMGRVSRTRGKKLHDPLAAICAIDPSIGRWAEVELYREGNSWGSRLAPGSQTWILVGYDHERFVQTLLETGP